MPPTPPLDDLERHQLAPHGTLRIGLAFGSTISAVWTMPDARTGAPAGPPAELGAALADWLGLPFDYVKLASSGEIVATADQDRWDVACAPVDAERKTQVDFTTDYFRGDSTYMVRRDAPFRRVADVDAEGVRVIGIENTATLRSARNTLRRAEARGVADMQTALAAFRAGEADAVALGRASLLALAEAIPAARVLEDHFHATGTALALPRGRPAAVARVTAFIEEAKQNGLIADILQRHGLPPGAAAPPGARS